MVDVTRLKVLLSMPVSELRSRHNALLELLREASAALGDFEAAEAHRESSAEMVILAQSVMKLKPLDKTADPSGYNALLTSAKSLAGSVLSQSDPTDGGDGAQAALPLEDAQARALVDAQRTGQALPLERTTVLGPDTTGPVRPDKEA